MKKNIGFIPLDSSFAAWLLEKLTKEPPISDSAEELRSGIRDMLNGEVNSLLLSATGEAELPPLTPPDVQSSSKYILVVVAQSLRKPSKNYRRNYFLLATKSIKIQPIQIRL